MKKLVIENKFNRKILKILKKVILVNFTRDRFHYFLIAMQISAKKNRKRQKEYVS